MEPAVSPSAVPDNGLKARLATVRARMDAAAKAAGRDPSEVTLLAVSKTFPATSVLEGLGCGLTEFGESRIQEALPKIDAVEAAEEMVDIIPHSGSPSCAWHLIGHLQKNKVAKAVGNFALIHSVDSLSLAERINRLAWEAGLIQPVLIQINISSETQKHGVLPDEALAVVTAAGKLPHITVQGLMGMAAKDQPAAPCFAALKKLFDDFQRLNIPGVTMRHLSMGMSGDFEAAIGAGATIVRVGSALFGDRRP
jgi:pyridoxal phosphate enzyme (YggS family)